MEIRGRNKHQMQHDKPQQILLNRLRYIIVGQRKFPRFVKYLQHPFLFDPTIEQPFRQAVNLVRNLTDRIEPVEHERLARRSMTEYDRFQIDRASVGVGDRNI